MKTTILFLLVILVVVPTDTMEIATPKTAKKPAAKKPADHSTYADMIRAAVTALKERGGSSRSAILKYIIANYKVGDEKTANAKLKKALKAAVTSGSLQQSKGAGAAGSFKLAKKKAKAKSKA